jgi:hypothetical protein
MDTSIFFEISLVSCSYTCYARSADNDGKYFPWDNVHFKTKEACERHMKLVDHDWLIRLVVVKVEHKIVS